MALGVILLVVLIGASTAQVLTRYVLNSSLIGTEELARYCFIWMSLLGGAICVGKWAHSSVSILSDLLPQKGKDLLFILINLLIVVCALIFLSGGMEMVQTAGSQLSPSLRIPKKFVYLSVPVGGFGMLLHSIEHMIRTLGKLFGKEESEESKEVEPS